MNTVTYFNIWQYNSNKFGIILIQNLTNLSKISIFVSIGTKGLKLPHIDTAPFLSTLRTSGGSLKTMTR